MNEAKNVKESRQYAPNLKTFAESKNNPIKGNLALVLTQVNIHNIDWHKF